nr:MAG TPA: hypothetical protein [Caudoviricetes sp.]
MFNHICCASNDSAGFRIVIIVELFISTSGSFLHFHRLVNSSPA